MKKVVHTGVMNRVRMSKEKSIYSQIITPFPVDHKTFEPNFFANKLPIKFMVQDKKVKELKEVVVKFTILGTWKDKWPLAKVVQIL